MEDGWGGGGWGLGGLLLGIGVGALAFAHSISSIIVTVVIWTAGEIVFLPTLSAYVADLAPRGRAGEYMGYYLMAWGIAFAVAPWLGTAVMQRFGSQTLWLASLGFRPLFAAVFFPVFVGGTAVTNPRNTEPPGEER